MFKNLLLWFPVVLSLAAAKNCTNLPPGLSKITKGVDISKFEFFPLDIAHDDGLLSPIFQLTCDQEKQWLSPKGVTYDMPDQIWQINSDPGGYMSSEVTSYTSYTEVRESMSSNAGLDVNIGEFAFSASSSYKTMQSYITNDSRYLTDVTSFVGVTYMNVNPPENLTLDNFPETYIDTTLTGTYESNPSAYNKFIEVYGTHYFSTGKFGGYIRMLFETTKEYFLNKTEDNIETNAKASFNKAFSASAGGSNSNVNVDETFNSNTKQISRYYGGDQNLQQNADGFSQWQPTVENDPWLCSGKLKPISDLMKNETKKTSMETAVKNYLIRSYLGELESLIYAARMKSDNSIISTFLGRLNDFKNSKEVSESAVVALSSDIEEYLSVPNWFVSTTKLCMHWSGTFDGFQCGGGGVTPQDLCADVNQMTPVYKDWTDWRWGGCKMQWAIFTNWTNPPAWLSQVKMCFQWYAEDDIYQCGGNAGEIYCAPINQNTPEYFDDTGNRNGGCQMRWMIQVPDNAPYWMKAVQMCYEWAAEGDASQCGGDAPSHQCVIANEWTQYYRDQTDDRWGGCDMKWGLKTSF
ncbi:perivitellin-2 67 kDa subunit-like [Physella acuta]|uniref:perivitellin-2 67 kDa subunit-like n=1 Tax=Physella acuta TaxID=109671 RepID=UPI0027DE0CCA|nr:perivitellin-2 67 kDa subunit-like [Physella acuta]